MFYFGSNDGNIYAVNGAGQTVWKLSTPLHNAAGSASAIAPNATLYLGWGNVLMAVKASGGLAESAWPMLQHDPRHTASIQTGVAVPTISTGLSVTGDFATVPQYWRQATTWLNGHHTIFGEVVKGQDVVEKISNVPRDPKDRPRTPVVINTVRIEEVK